MGSEENNSGSPVCFIVQRLKTGEIVAFSDPRARAERVEALARWRVTYSEISTRRDTPKSLPQKR